MLDSDHVRSRQLNYFGAFRAPEIGDRFRYMCDCLFVHFWIDRQR